MIVQIRGGSGSGKSTLVREWVDDHGEHERHMMEVARFYGLGHINCAASRPFALEFKPEGVVVVGHYDAPGGGADMIKSVYHIYDVVRKAVEIGRDVLVESLFMSKDAKATLELLDWAKERGEAVHIILLDLPEQDCYDSVQERRRVLGKEERHLRAHSKDYHAAHKSMLSVYQKWHEEGLITFHHLGRIDASLRVRELIG